MRLTPTDLRSIMSRPAMAKANSSKPLDRPKEQYWEASAVAGEMQAKDPLPPVPAQITNRDCGGRSEKSTGAGGNLLHLRLDGIPPSKKNSHMIIVNPKTKRPMVIPKKEYRDWEKAAAESLLKQYYAVDGFVRLFPLTRTTPCRIHILYAVKGMRSWDLSNKSESVLDALVRSGILEDDNRFVVKSLEMSSILASKDVVSITITPA